MGMYLMMMYVSLEQEEAVKHFFSTKGWPFQKPDLSVLTDRTGPLSIIGSESHPTPPPVPVETELSPQKETNITPVKLTAARAKTRGKTKSPKQQGKKGKARATRRSANTNTAHSEFQEILKEAELIAASVSEIVEAEDNDVTEESVKLEQDVEQTDSYYDDTHDDYDDFNERQDETDEQIKYDDNTVTQGPSDQTPTRRKRKLVDRGDESDQDDFDDLQEAAIKVKRTSTTNSNHRQHIEGPKLRPRTRGQSRRLEEVEENLADDKSHGEDKQTTSTQLPVKENPDQLHPHEAGLETDKQGFSLEVPSHYKDQKMVRQNSPLQLVADSKSVEAPVQVPTSKVQDHVPQSLENSIQFPSEINFADIVLQNSTVHFPSTVQESSVPQQSSVPHQSSVPQQSSVQQQKSLVQFQASNTQGVFEQSSVPLPVYSSSIGTAQQSSVHLPSYSQTLETVQQSSVQLPVPIYSKALETIQQPPPYSKAVENHIDHSLVQLTVTEQDVTVRPVQQTMPVQSSVDQQNLVQVTLPEQNVRTVQQTISMQPNLADQQSLAQLPPQDQVLKTDHQPAPLPSTSNDQQSNNTVVLYEAVNVDKNGPPKQENDSVMGIERYTPDFMNTEDHFKIDPKRYFGANPDEPLFIKFTELEEKNVVDFLTLLYNLGYGFTKNDMAKIATEYAVYLRKRTRDQPIIMHWTTEMIGKWPELQLVKRKCRMNLTGILSKFFNHLENVMKKFSFDERPELVFSVTDIEIRQDDAESGEEKILTTVIACGSAAGQAVPPFFVFPGQKMTMDLMSGAMPGSSGVVSEDGLVNAEVFIQFLKEHLLKNIPEKDVGKPVLVHMNAVKFCSVGLLDLARKHNVTLIFPPAEIPNALMPLDVGCIDPFQTEYTRECEKHIQETMTDITKDNVCGIVGKIYARALTDKNIKEGFRKAGLFPCNSGMLIVKRNT